MAEPTDTIDAESTAERPPWGRRLAIGGGALLLLLIVAYFVATMLPAVDPRFRGMDRRPEQRLTPAPA